MKPAAFTIQIQSSNFLISGEIKQYLPAAARDGGESLCHDNWKYIKKQRLAQNYKPSLLMVATPLSLN